MPSQVTSPASEDSEEGRAFLQARVALFWKVWFFIGLVSAVLSTMGAVAEPGMHFWLDLVGTAQAGLFWQLCVRGQRSIRFSRLAETGGLVVQLTLVAFMMRYLLGSFYADHPVTTVQGATMTDGYVSMMLMTGAALHVAIRAALIPSRPVRTIIVTALVGVPAILVSAAWVPDGDGGLAWRAAGSHAFPLLPMNSAILWGFVIIMCTVISSVIYNLRVKVREARRLGQYVLEQKLGEGGMGEVYRAHHGMMRRPSAIKLLRPDRAGETNLRRFEREVQLTAQLTHPNTIVIYDYGRTDDNVFYYAMELLDGATLRRIVEVDGPQPAGRVVRILAMACGALSEAHSVGLIHRDIKPANIMLCTRGGQHDVVKVLDFGLVKQLDVDREINLTGPDTVTGTPMYMAPESIRDPDSVDARTDIYALGAVAYYLLTGTDVFDGKSVVEVCGQHLHEQPIPPTERGIAVPADLEALVLACLDKDPNARPQSAVEFLRQVQACQVERWDSGQAEAWWREHQDELTGCDRPAAIDARAIGVDRSRPRVLTFHHHR